MAYTDALQKFRGSGYGNKGKDDEDGSSSPSRLIQLTDEEKKSLEPYQVKPGEEIEFIVSGKVESDGHLHVMSVEYNNQGGPDVNADAEEAMKQSHPEMMRAQVSPSPS